MKHSYILSVFLIVLMINQTSLETVKELVNRTTLEKVKESVNRTSLVTVKKSVDQKFLEIVTKRIVPKYDIRYAIQNYTINPHPFEYIYNPEFKICNPSDKIFVLIYVHSTPGNFKRRITLRETWARRSMFRDIRIIFTMGKTDEEKVNELLKLENNIYNDLVQEDFHDSYKNLTYKGIMAMKWISKYCKQTKFILKVDDDVFTNTFILLRHLDYMDKHKYIKNNTFLCAHYYEFSMPVMRAKGNKWYVPPELFAPDYYSPYCSGSAFLFTGDLPGRMYENSKRIKFFWVDDFYISGLLAQSCNVTYNAVHSLYKLYFKVENSILRLWDHAYENQMSRYINLKRNEAYLLEKGDFFDSKEFNWNMNVWKPFLEPIIDSDTSILFNQDTF